MSFKEISVQDIYKSDSKLKREDVQSLMEWSKMQPHLPYITELQTALFLHSCYGRNELAKNTIDVYFTVKTLCPDIFGNRVPSDPAIQNAMNCVLTSYLPKLTPGGDRVVLLKMVDTNPDAYNLAQQVKCFDMLSLAHLHKNGPDNGLHILIDMKGVVLAHVLKLNVVIMKKFLYYLQEGMPIRLKSMQFMNIVPFMDKILAIMKPFMKKELIDSLVLHNNMESVFKIVPKDIFPQEYGGDCESIDILLEKYKAVINDSVDLFKFEDSQMVDESKRPGKPKSISEVFGMAGTFKKLDVD